MAKTKIEVIYSDDEIIVINKPSGISVTKDRTGSDSIIDILETQHKDLADKLRLIHRLDKLTSGVMMIAKTPEAQSRYSALFAKRRIRKTYLALCRGFAPSERGTIKAPLARSLRDKKIMCVSTKRGKEALTQWRLLADFNLISLVAASPVTGRTHQLRVHLPNIGLPLAIDPVYGTDKPLMLSEVKTKYRVAQGQTEKPLIDRLTLHAYQLEFEAGLAQDDQSTDFADADGNIARCFVAGLDKKFKAAVKMLTKHNPAGLDAFADAGYYEAIINSQPLPLPAD
jgi:RluA family pseudouridine synthase